MIDHEEAVKETVSDYRKAVYEFALSQHPEDFQRMMDGQVKLVSLASAAAPQVVADEPQVIDCEKCEGHGATHYPDGEWEGKCGACHGTGWVSRDADIGTEQECFSCDGRGKSDDAAPVQAQEPFMYGIVGPDGKAHIDENCVAGEKDSTALHVEVNCLNDSPDSGYSIVPLFRAPVQPVAVPDDREAFESAFAKTELADPNAEPGKDYALVRASNGDYAANATHAAWVMWQVARAAPAAQGDALSLLLDNMLSIEVEPGVVHVVAMATESERDEDMRGEILTSEPWHKNGPSLKKATIKAIERAIAAKAAS